MSSASGLFLAARRSASVINYCQKRFRYKQRWASKIRSKLPHELALDHFDLYYKPVFGSHWPSMRLALLSQPKYCAVLNNFVLDQQKVVLELAEHGAGDFIWLAKNTSPTKRYSLLANASISDSTETAVKLDHSTGESVEKSNWDSGLTQFDLASNTNIYDFMPVKKILSDREQMQMDEIEQNIHRPGLIPVEIVPSKSLCFPHHLQPFSFGRGDTALFPPAGKDGSSKLTYYLMDAGSVLPVIALELEPGCEVLDLCAAPGGKSYSILQTLLPDKLTCVDHSYNRIGRLKEVIKLFLPRSYVDEKKIAVVHANGIAFCAQAPEQFDRVLVDVPCYADRHALSDEHESSLFRNSRIEERLAIQNIQRDLLFSGIKSCKRGGVVVYSTCTLSLPQNDGTVQATLEKICQETDWEVVIEDTGLIADHFRKTFNFYRKCRYGQLVIPNLTANFGPTYFCKLRRIK